MSAPGIIARHRSTGTQRPFRRFFHPQSSYEGAIRNRAGHRCAHCPKAPSRREIDVILLFRTHDVHALPSPPGSNKAPMKSSFFDVVTCTLPSFV